MKLQHIIISFFVLAEGPVCGVFAQSGKMSPWVRQAVLKEENVDESIGLVQPAGVFRQCGQQGDGPSICAFVQFDGDEACESLAANGCQVVDRQGDIAVVIIPRHRLRALAACASVRRIEASRPCGLAMDTVPAVVRALDVYAGTRLPQAYTGRGVVVGVMDVGFDLTHPNFYDCMAHAYRVKAFWDQLSRDTVGSGMPVGRDYADQASILSVQHSVDGYIQTHGTHTLGTAAGSGWQSPYRGMAYESDLCLVSNAVSEDIALIDSADLYKYTSATDALGFKYIFDYAEAHGLPCVASFSEGYRLRFDDDDRLYAEYLDRLTGPGRIIVASAGNESVHRGYFSKPSGTASAGSYLYVNANTGEVSVSGRGHFTVSLMLYEGERADTLTISPECCPLDSTVSVPFVTASGRKAVDVTVSRYLSAFDAGTTVLDVALRGDTLLRATAYPLAFTIQGSDAEAEARLVSSESVFINRDTPAPWTDATIFRNTLVPGCFPGVVTVGATVHRTGYVNIDGQYVDNSQPGRNDGVRSYYSSIGPAVDGTCKPDVMAPGNNVISSCNSFYMERHVDSVHDREALVSCFDFQGRTYGWNVNTGTSMSAPVVAGAVALWLQACPTLTAADVKRVLARTARHPDTSLDYPNNYYGYGEIDVYRGLLDILGLDAVPGLSASQPVGVSVSLLSSGQMVLSFVRRPLGPVLFTLYRLDGVAVCSKRLVPADGLCQSVALPPLPAGVYAVQLSSSESDFTGSLLVRVP